MRGREGRGLPPPQALSLPDRLPAAGSLPLAPCVCRNNGVAVAWVGVCAVLLVLKGTDVVPKRAACNSPPPTLSSIHDDGLRLQPATGSGTTWLPSACLHTHTPTPTQAHTHTSMAPLAWLTSCRGGHGISHLPTCLPAGPHLGRARSARLGSARPRLLSVLNAPR